MGVYTQQKRGWRHSGACNVYTMHALHLTVTAGVHCCAGCCDSEEAACIGVEVVWRLRGGCVEAAWGRRFGGM